MSDTDWLESVAKLGELPKLVVTKVCDAIGLVYEPTHVRRITAAEAERMRVLATAEADVSDIRTRAALRQQAEQLRYQRAIEEVTVRALPHLTGAADPAKVDDDWIVQFFGKARDLTTEEMRALWARILAGEFNKPGAFSRRTLGVVGDLDKRHTESFSTLCRFAFRADNARLPVVWGNVSDQLYRDALLSYSDLAELDSAGLLRLDAMTGFFIETAAPNVRLDYFGQQVDVVMPAYRGVQLPIGSVILTRAGLELATICEATTPIPGFLEYNCNMWLRHQVMMRVEPSS